MRQAFGSSPEEMNDNSRGGRAIKENEQFATYLSNVLLAYLSDYGLSAFVDMDMFNGHFLLTFSTILIIMGPRVLGLAVDLLGFMHHKDSAAEAGFTPFQRAVRSLRERYLGPPAGEPGSDGELECEILECDGWSARTPCRRLGGDTHEKLAMNPMHREVRLFLFEIIGDNQGDTGLFSAAANQIVVYVCHG
jgi:hypothetical protein